MALVTDCCTVSEISCRFGGMVLDTCFITSSARYSRSFWKDSFVGAGRSDRGLRYGADSFCKQYDSSLCKGIEVSRVLVLRLYKVCYSEGTAYYVGVHVVRYRTQLPNNLLQSQIRTS